MAKRKNPKDQQPELQFDGSAPSPEARASAEPTKREDPADPTDITATNGDGGTGGENGEPPRNPDDAPLADRKSVV